ncbi:MAG: hypothetical protein CR982_04090 [Candidatus Cloacimonadota bacterium]|nr:MAG: hypothetical protein CR982_04090 [Candidatus Cloacimonadota bacterium]PIE77866.1 MAG: hypothetical protein CSA15_10800 [Candidatus Delongbacteria bacterium]
MENRIYKTLIVILIALLASCSNDDSSNPTGSSGSEYRIVKINLENYDQSSGLWSGKFEMDMEYDSHGRLEKRTLNGYEEKSISLEEEFIYENNSTSLPEKKLYANDYLTDIFSYESGKIKKVVTKSENLDDEKIIYTYENNLLIKKEIFQNYDNDWELDYQTDWAYDEEGRLLEKVEAYAYDNPTKYIYSWADGNIVEIVVSYQNYSGDWENSSKYEFNYDGKKLITSIKYSNQNYDWLPINKREYKYNGSHISYAENFVWNDYESKWNKNSKNEYNYTNGNLVGIKTSVWENENYTLSEKVDITYENENGNYEEIKKISNPEDYYTGLPVSDFGEFSFSYDEENKNGYAPLIREFD